MSTEPMAIKSLSFNFSDPSANILIDNGFVINPSNARQWSDYQVEATDKSPSGFRVVTATGDVNPKGNDLLQSMLYSGDTGLLVKVNNPIITTSKAIGQTVIGESCYVVSMGNSRLVLLNNLHSANQSLETPVSIELAKLNHDIDVNLDIDDLFIEQVRDNTSVDLTFGQRLSLISLYLGNLSEGGSTATEAVKIAANRFGVSDQICYVAKRFAGFPEWFQDLEGSIFIRNAEILDKIYSLYVKASKSIDGLTLEKLWADLSSMAAGVQKPITAKLLSDWKSQYLPKDIVVADETESDSEGDSEGGSEDSEGGSEDDFTDGGFDYKNSSDQEIYDHLQSVLKSLVTDEDEATGEPITVACPSVLWDNLSDGAYSGKRLITAAKLLERYSDMLSKAQMILTDSEIQEQKEAAELEKANAEIEKIAEDFATSEETANANF